MYDLSAKEERGLAEAGGRRYALEDPAMRKFGFAQLGLEGPANTIVIRAPRNDQVLRPSTPGFGSWTIGRYALINASPGTGHYYVVLEVPIRVLDAGWVFGCSSLQHSFCVADLPYKSLV